MRKKTVGRCRKCGQVYKSIIPYECRRCGVQLGYPALGLNRALGGSGVEPAKNLDYVVMKKKLLGRWKKDK